MQRNVITPAELGGEALNDLKGWLGISRPKEDDLLTDLLATSLAICEGFTGQAPIEQTIEESIPVSAGVTNLSSRPVRALLSAEAVSSNAARSALADQAYDMRITASGVACFTLMQAPDADFVVLTLRAGIAQTWEALPGPLKQGMIRLAAFNYRDRETGKDATPPVSVTALWRPWQIMRLT